MHLSWQELAVEQKAVIVVYTLVIRMVNLILKDLIYNNIAFLDSFDGGRDVLTLDFDHEDFIVNFSRS